MGFVGRTQRGETLCVLPSLSLPPQSLFQLHQVRLIRLPISHDSNVAVKCHQTGILLVNQGQHCVSGDHTLAWGGLTAQTPGS